MLLKEETICASPVLSTITLRFLTVLLVPFAILSYYLVAFFLLATVLRFPLRVRELFLVRCPRNGRPSL